MDRFKPYRFQFRKPLRRVKTEYFLLGAIIGTALTLAILYRLDLSVF